LTSSNEIIIVISSIGILFSIARLFIIYRRSTTKSLLSDPSRLAPLFQHFEEHIAVFDSHSTLRYASDTLRTAAGVAQPEVAEPAVSNMVSSSTEGERPLIREDGASGTIFWRRAEWGLPRGRTFGVVLVGRPIDRESVTDDFMGTGQLEIEAKLLEKNKALLRANHSLAQSRTQLQRLVEKLYDIKDKEGIRVSRELHDELGQVLTGLKIEVVLLQRKIVKEVLPETKPAGLIVAEILALVDQAIGRVQTLSKELRPPMLDKLGLIDTFETVLKETAKQTGLVYEINHNIEAENLPTETLTYAYRIFKETISSLASQEAVKQVSVQVEKEENQIRITIGDDGGADPELLFGESSVGILGMTEYARKYGGTFALSGDREGGLHIHVTLPLNP
jgi:signal transduction histidine kinase